MSADQLRRTLTLLETLLDYLPGPQMIRSQADALPVSESARPRTYTPAERDRQLAHLEHQARLRRADYDRESFPWERARREQYAQGDYAALDKQLAVLAVENARWYDLAWRVVSHHPGLLDLELRVEFVCMIRWLAERLPDPIRLPAWTTPAAPPTPAALLVLRDMGVPYSVLARVYGRHANTLRKRVRKVSA